MPPAYALALLLVVLSGTAFHALFGRTWRGLLSSMAAATAGFLIGEALARFMGLTFGQVGPLHPVLGVTGAWLAMAVARRWWA